MYIGYWTLNKYYYVNERVHPTWTGLPSLSAGLLDDIYLRSYRVYMETFLGLSMRVKETLSAYLIAG